MDLEKENEMLRAEVLRQREQIERLATARAEPIITLPRLATPRLDAADLELLAAALASAVPIGPTQ